MLTELRKARYPVETGLLLAFCFFLPLLEFWKNVALVGYAVAWLINRMRSREFGGPWRVSDTLVALWIGSAYLAAAFAGMEGRAVAKTGDILASAVLFWMAARAGYAERERRWMLGVLVASTLVGLVIGFGRLWSGMAKNGALELYSVGHVNHTAIYLAIMLGVCTSWLFARWRAWRPSRRTLALLVSALVLVSLVITASRGAVGIGLLLLVALALAWWPRWRAPLAAVTATLAVVVVVLTGLGSEVVRKQQENVAEERVLAFRDRLWRAGIVAWEQHPWFGVGKDNYVLINQERIQSWRSGVGETYDPKRYFFSSHGHSLFVTTLVERGIVGFAALLAVLAAAAYSLVRCRPGPHEEDAAWLDWGSAAGAWFVTVGVGVVNTTFHHEHGLLAALLFGLWLSTLHPPRAS